MKITDVSISFHDQATIHSRVMGTCSAQLPEPVSAIISQLQNKDDHEQMKRSQLPCEAEKSMLMHEINEEVLKRMATEVLLKANTSSAQRQLGRHRMGEIKDDLGSLFKDMARQRAHRGISQVRCGVPRTTFTELGCLVVTN